MRLSSIAHTILTIRLRGSEGKRIARDSSRAAARVARDIAAFLLAVPVRGLQGPGFKVELVSLDDTISGFFRPADRTTLRKQSGQGDRAASLRLYAGEEFHRVRRGLSRLKSVGARGGPPRKVHVLMESAHLATATQRLDSSSK
jgi:hypothetical protein